MAKATSLLKAYQSESIPTHGGFIISSNFDADTVYSIYEITAFSSLKDIYLTGDAFNFKTDGDRTHILVEPPIYTGKSVEPTYREDGKSIPYRFYEMTIITGKKQEKIMIPKKPVTLHSYFTVQNAKGNNFAFLFYPTEDVYVAIKKFIADSLYNDANVEKTDAVEASKVALETIKQFTIWNS
ncbi:MAG: hypothetical protein JXN64_10900 [Spirochaetes bacterium]|nr:hypothetical protein [Spirochaetota bacterium]